MCMGNGGHPGERPWDPAEDAKDDAKDGRAGAIAGPKGGSTQRDRTPVEVGEEVVGTSGRKGSGKGVPRADFSPQPPNAQMVPSVPKLRASPAVVRTDPGQGRGEAASLVPCLRGRVPAIPLMAQHGVGGERPFPSLLYLGSIRLLTSGTQSVGVDRPCNLVFPLPLLLHNLHRCSERTPRWLAGATATRSAFPPRADPLGGVLSLEMGPRGRTSPAPKPVTMVSPLPPSP